MGFNFDQIHTALIVGAGHGIGLEISKLLEERGVKEVIATYRNADKASELLSSNITALQVDPCEEKEIENLSYQIKSVDLIINCVGMLHNENIWPEKSLKYFDQDSFLEIMRVNATVAPLIAKHFEKKLNKSISVFANISAKIGSIEDNRLGGWYSYRASKAALNMLVKNISIEFERNRRNCIVLAIHPGTTDTELSKPFAEHTSYKIHTPKQTAANILKIIEGSELDDSGSFYHWDGSLIKW